MEILKYDIFQLLNNNKKIKIPFFQRQYIWSFKDQINTLLNDITHCNYNYYLGNIIFKHENGKSNKLIIDGQQRLTTFLILFSVLKNEFKYSNDYLQNIHTILDQFEFDSFYVKNKDILSKILKNKLNEISEYDENTQYYKNYIDIKNHLKKYFNNEEKINSLINKIHNIQFAQIILDNEINENILFSQINSTGVQLSEYDLFKNHILTKLIDNAKLNNNFSEYKIEEWVNQLDKINNSLSQNKNEQDELLRSFIAFKIYLLCNSKKIYLTYCKYENNEFSDVLKTYDEYCKFGFYYKYIINKEYKKDFDFSVFQFITEEFKTYSSLIIFVLQQFSKIENDKILILETSKNELIECIKIIDHYIISRKFSPNTQDKVITRKIPTFIKDIIEMKKNYSNLSFSECLYLILIWIPINESKKKNEEYKYRASDTNELEYFFSNENIYGKNSKFVKNFLIKISKILDNKIDYDFSNKWTIEHVIPQNPEKWKQNGYDEEDFSKINTIGNLTLTKYNSELSNEIFTIKKRELFNKEGSILNNYFINLDDWNNDEISKRSKYLFDVYNNYFDNEKIIRNIFKKYDQNSILKTKLNSIDDEKLINLEKNLIYFKNENIDKEKIINLLKQYYLLKSGEKAELAVLKKTYKGWIINSIKNFIDTDFENYSNIDEFIENKNEIIIQFLQKIDKKLDEKDI